MRIAILIYISIIVALSWSSLVLCNGEIIYLNRHGGNISIGYSPKYSATEFIERLALDADFGQTIVGIPQLYDDGTHGDKVADDGTYSIEIKIPKGAKQVKLLFYILNTDGNEVEIGPVVREIPSTTE